jgi:hypothetical protein
LQALELLSLAAGTLREAQAGLPKPEPQGRLRPQAEINLHQLSE